MKRRYLQPLIERDMADRMVFIGGPRQVGKTTLSRQVGGAYPGFLYLNWDSRDDRQKIIGSVFPSEMPLIIFDEIHKYKGWKNYLKGLYDTRGSSTRLLATGSARLDVYRRGGDSLFGRYRYYRLHPFSLREAIGRAPDIAVFQPLSFLRAKNLRAVFQSLYTFGGFPKPFTKKDGVEWRRFQNERVELVIKQDIRDLEHVHDLSGLEVLVELLPGKVGSLLSANALQEDLQVTHKTVAHWLTILERFYYHFRIYPFASTKIKSLRKQPKMYLWDWSATPDGPARLENIVGSHLLKLVHYLYDAFGYKAELYYLRDVEGREVDFLVAIDKKPWFAVEVKTGDQAVASSLPYFAKRLKIPFMYQIVSDTGVDVMNGAIRIMSVEKFLSGLV